LIRFRRFIFKSLVKRAGQYTIDGVIDKACFQSLREMIIMSLQDHNAGNAGDLVKHGLLVELLSMIAANETSLPWSYSETHSGAGRFATGRASVLADALTAEGLLGAPGNRLADLTCDPAGAYGQLLADWWGIGETAGEYPGSPVIASMAGRYLAKKTFVEADPEVFARLETAMASVAARETDQGEMPVLRKGSFEIYLEELLAPDRLLLMIDPFYYHRDATDGLGGRVGLGHLTGICRRLAEKEAILLFFTSRFPRHLRGDDGIAGTWKQLDHDLAALAPPVCRCFQAVGTTHAVHVVGWGEAGATLVGQLPAAKDWETSWLARKPISLQLSEA
jgi:hypothetical protein